jgi:hypothetical protein
LRCRVAYPHGTGILTRFPFAGTGLRARLGPANPWPTNVAKETWPFPAEGILTPLRCYFRRDPHSERVHRTSRPGFYPTPTPAYRISPALRRSPGVSAADLAPTNLRGPQPRRVSCYALHPRRGPHYKWRLPTLEDGCCWAHLPAVLGWGRPSIGT